MLIKNKVDESIILIDLFREYYVNFEIGFAKLKLLIVNDIQNKIFSEYPEKRKKLLQRIDALSTEIFTDITNENKQKLIFQTYSLLKQFDYIIENIYEIIKKYSFVDKSIYIDSEISLSTLHNSINKEIYITKKYEYYIKTYHKTTELFVIKEMTSILTKSLKNLSVEELKKNIYNIDILFRKYINTIHLYSHVMQTLLNISIKEKIIFELILNLIEQNKSYVLQPSTYDDKKIVHINAGKQNPFLRSFGLIPSTEFKNIDKLFPNIFNSKNFKYSESDFQNLKILDDIFKNISQKKNTDILVLQNITNNPISHELWNLVRFDKTPNIDLNDSPNSGITESLIKKTRTIRELPIIKKWILSSYKIYGNFKSNKIYILETLNNKTYRFLRYWWSLRENNIEYPINKSKCIGLLKYLNIPITESKKDKIYLKSTKKEIDRIILYQKCHEQSLEKIFLKKQVDLDILTKKSQFSVDSSKIKEKCWFNIYKIILKIIKQVINPVDQIGLVITYKKIYDTFENTILDMHTKFYHVYNIKSLDISNDFISSEILSTFLYLLKKLKYEFSKIMRVIYEKNIEEDKQELESITTLPQLLVKIELLIKEGLNEIITQDKNIFQELLFKFNLLLLI